MKKLEEKIGDLQKELTELRKQQAAIRLKACLGDSEIRQKDEKLETLDTQATDINRTLHDLQRQRQLLMAQCILKGTSDLHP